MKILAILCLLLAQTARAQQPKAQWIKPGKKGDPAIWGIKNGIIIGIWPAAIDGVKPTDSGGPRGLLRIGYDCMDVPYLINYIAVEPVVNGDMEFSEVSPSRLDGKLGKHFWASNAVVRHPDPRHPETEELSLYVHMEKFIDGAHPYLRLSIRSDRPDELCLQIFNEANSVTMERCALTATMGNYSRLRLLYLKDRVVDSRQLFAGYADIEFAEKNPYPAGQLLRNKKGDYMAIAEPSEAFAELASWPQDSAYLRRWRWRYRPFYPLTQYWRKEATDSDTTLQVRVNGRVKYWSGGSDDKRNYIDIPGGAAFENFEMRERYHSGQTFYFGLTRKTAKELMDDY